MHTFKLKILTPDEKLFDGEVSQVVLPTKAGEITVLANHIPLISLLSIGEIKITPAPLYQEGQVQQEQTERKFLVQGGVIDVKQNIGKIDEVVILADEKIDAEKVDLKTFEESIARAKDANLQDHSDYDPEIFEGLAERSAYFKRLKS